MRRRIGEAQAFFDTNQLAPFELSPAVEHESIEYMALGAELLIPADHKAINLYPQLGDPLVSYRISASTTLY